MRKPRTASVRNTDRTATTFSSTRTSGSTWKRKIAGKAPEDEALRPRRIHLGCGAHELEVDPPYTLFVIWKEEVRRPSWIERR